MRQRRPLHLLNEGRCLLHQRLKCCSVAGMGGAKRLHYTLFPALCLLYNLHADRAGLVGFLAYKHDAKLARGTQICKFCVRN